MARESGEGHEFMELSHRVYDVNVIDNNCAASSKSFLFLVRIFEKKKTAFCKSQFFIRSISK